MSNPEAAPAENRLSRRLLKISVYILVVAAACWGAYEARVAMFRQSSPSRSMVLMDSHRQATSAPASQPWDLDAPPEMAGAPLTEEGLAALQGDPDGIAPPPGAKAALGFHQRAGGLVRQQRIYECPGDLKTVQSQYCDALAHRGYKLLQERTLPDGSVTLLLMKGDTQADLALRNLPASPKMVRVVLIVTTELE